MSSSQIHKLTNDLAMYTGSFVCSKADVIIPVETISAMTDSEIGRLARELIPNAVELNLEEICDGLVRNGELRQAPEDYLRSIYSKLIEYIGNDEKIINTRSQIYDVLIETEERQANRDSSRAARKKFSGKRNKLFDEIGKRDGLYCALCMSEDNLTVDHIVSLVQGGTDEPDNLQILCRPCNSRKGAR